MEEPPSDQQEAGSGKYSLDEILDIRLPLGVLAVATTAAAVTTLYGIAASQESNSKRSSKRAQLSGGADPGVGR